MSWVPQYDADGVPFQAHWAPDTGPRVQRCPRTWPHEPHGPWFTGAAYPAGVDPRHHCPGVPLPEPERRTTR